jgi:hypothetical protein
MASTQVSKSATIRAQVNHPIIDSDGHLVEGRAEEILRSYQIFMSRGEDPALLDEWAPSGIGSPEEICHLFTQRFYFWV